MLPEMRDILRNNVIEASAPCRIDLGGTLDIRTFYLPLAYLSPCTFNIALDMRTTVRISGHKPGYVRIASRGFETAEFPVDKLPFDHPLGLMFAVAAHFRLDGVAVEIASASPPRSALGGSSVAAAALIGAISELLHQCGRKRLPKRQIVLLAHGIEESAAGVPCGSQDQLAAVFGGVNAWHWPDAPDAPPYRRRVVFRKHQYRQLSDHLLVAYCGVPHESRDVNGRWVRQFLKGECRREWIEIVNCTKKFIDSLLEHNYKGAAAAMRYETAVRCRMTPDVLDDIGLRLSNAATEYDCGARFAGAGGGGCVWALGESAHIRQLKPVWRDILSRRPTACILDVGIDSTGLAVRGGNAV